MKQKEDALLCLYLKNNVSSTNYVIRYYVGRVYLAKGTS